MFKNQNSEILLGFWRMIRGRLDLKPISELDAVEPDAYVDILGVVNYVSEPATIVSKETGKKLFKYELTVGDDWQER